MGNTQPDILIQIVFPIVLLGMNLIMTIGVAVIIFFMRGKRDSDRDQFKELKDSDEKLAKELRAKDEKLADDLTQFKTKLPHQYVLRDDFIRILTSFDHKLDAQVEALNKIQASIREKL